MYPLGKPAVKKKDPVLGQLQHDPIVSQRRPGILDRHATFRELDELTRRTEAIEERLEKQR
jgi:hypothetical protein